MHLKRAFDFHKQHQPPSESQRVAIQKGLDDAAAGRITTFATDDELAAFFGDVKQNGRKRLAAGRLDRSEDV